MCTSPRCSLAYCELKPLVTQTLALHATQSVTAICSSATKHAHLEEVNMPGRLRPKALRGDAVRGGQLVHDVALLLGRDGQAASLLGSACKVRQLGFHGLDLAAIVPGIVQQLRRPVHLPAGRPGIAFHLPSRNCQSPGPHDTFPSRSPFLWYSQQRQQATQYDKHTKKLAMSHGSHIP